MKGRLFQIDKDLREFRREAKPRKRKKPRKPTAGASSSTSPRLQRGLRESRICNADVTQGKNEKPGQRVSKMPRTTAGASSPPVPQRKKQPNADPAKKFDTGISPAPQKHDPNYAQSFGEEIMEERITAEGKTAGSARSLSLKDPESKAPPLRTEDEPRHIHEGKAMSIDIPQVREDNAAAAFSWDELEADEPSHTDEGQAISLSTDTPDTTVRSGKHPDEPEAVRHQQAPGQETLAQAKSATEAPAAAFSWDELEENDHSDTEKSEDTFKEDLRAIMSGQKSFDPATKSVAPPAPKAPEPEPAPEKAGRYAIFDRMAKAQSFVNTFDLGTIEVQQRMDELDRELDEEQSKKNPLPVKPRH